MIPFRSPILSALDSLQLGDRVATTGTASVPPLLANWGAGTVDVGADARTGSILSAGSVFLRERATVQGSIETGSTLTRQSGTTVTGSVAEHATVQLPAAPAITIAWPATVKSGFTVESGSSWTRTEGAYGNVTVRSNGTLVLGAGTYFFVSLLLESDAKVVVEPGTTLHVRDGLTLRGQFKNASGTVAQVAVQYRGTNPAIAEREFHGSILAPNAQLVLGATHPVAFGGQFLARQIVARPDASFAAELLEWGWIFPVPPAEELVFQGDARVVVHSVAGDAEFRATLSGAGADGTFAVAVGESRVVRAGAGTSWRLLLERREPDGTWRPWTFRVDRTVRNGQYEIDYLVPDSGSKPVLRVERDVSVPVTTPFVLSGSVAWKTGAPYVGRLNVYDKDFRNDQLLATATAGADGSFEVRFETASYLAAESKGPDLYLVAVEREIPRGVSDVLFNAASPARIDLVLEGSSYDSLCEFEEVEMRILPLLGSVAPSEFRFPDDVDFLAKELTEDRSRIEAYLRSRVLATEVAEVPPMAFYGWIRMGLPAALSLLRQRSSEELVRELKRAQLENVVDFSRQGIDIEGFARRVAERLADSRTERFQENLAGLSPDLGLDADKIGKIVRLHGESQGSMPDFWKSLVEQEALTEAEAAALQVHVALRSLCSNNPRLTRALHGRIGLDARDTSGLAAIDLDAMSDLVDQSEVFEKPPAGVDERILAQYRQTVRGYAKTLLELVEYAHPKAVLSHGLRNATGVEIDHARELLRANPWIDPRQELPPDSKLELPAGWSDPSLLQTAKMEMESLRSHLVAFPPPVAEGGSEATRQELVESVLGSPEGERYRGSVVGLLVQALDAAVGYEFGKTKLELYLQRNPWFLADLEPASRQAVLSMLKALTRLYSIVPRKEVAMRLLERGYRSASDIAQVSEEDFVLRFGQEGFGVEVAISIHRACRKKSQAVAQVFQAVQSDRSGVSAFAVGGGDPDTGRMPSWERLFERPTSMIVPEWQSVLSPAAYFVDLLRYLKTLSPPPGTDAPYAALLRRRPDLQHIPLDRAATFDEISHSQLVLEILEAYVARRGEWAGTKWTSMDWGSIRAEAQELLESQVYPLEHPVDLEMFEREVLVRKFGLEFHRILESIAPTTGHDLATELVCRTIGISETQRRIVADKEMAAGGSVFPLEEIWGCLAADLDVLSWSVPVIMDRAKITLVELDQYLRTRYCGGDWRLHYLPDQDLDTLAVQPGPLTRDELRKMNRFFRLLKELRQIDPSRTVHELDSAIGRLGANLLDEAFLRNLASAMRLAARWNLSWFPMLEACAGIETWKESVLGEDGTMILLPSRLHSLFQVAESDPDFAIVPSTGEFLRTTLAISDKIEALQKGFPVSRQELVAAAKAVGIDPAESGSFKVASLSKIRRILLLAELLDMDHPTLGRTAILTGRNPSDPNLDVVDLLDTCSRFADLELPGGVLEYLFLDRTGGTDPVEPIESITAESVLAELAAGYAEIDAGLEGMVVDPSTGGPSLEATRARRKTEQLGKTLGEALDVSPEIVIHLLSEHLTSLGDASRKGIHDFLDGLLQGDEFAKALRRLHKTSLFAVVTGLSSAELDALRDATAQWGGFDLDDFTPDADGSINNDAIAWLRPVGRYLVLRKTRSQAKKNAPALLSALKDGVTTDSDWQAIVAATGWSREDLEELARISGVDPTAMSNADFLYKAIDAMDILRKTGSDMVSVAKWLSVSDRRTSMVREALHSRFSANEWETVSKKLESELRNFRRERMIEFVLNHSDLPESIRTAEQLYQWFLIDVKMDAGQTTSRIVQAIATVQQFVQRCTLNLEKGATTSDDAGGGQDPRISFQGVSPTAFDAKRWEWMKNYRVWEANRKVFLFPENYLEPELRADKSEFFQELEDDLMESTISEESAEKAFHDYLQKLDSVARIRIVAQSTDPNTKVLHVFGRTEGLPGVHYHRTRDTSGVWSGWKKLPVEIESEHLAPVFNNRRLYLHWLEFKEKADQPSEESINAPSNAGHQAQKPEKHWEIHLCWTEYRYGQWSAKKMSTPEGGSSDAPTEGTTLRLLPETIGMNLKNPIIRVIQPFECRLRVDYPGSREGTIYRNYFGVSAEGMGSQFDLRVLRVDNQLGQVARTIHSKPMRWGRDGGIVDFGGLNTSRYVGGWTVKRPGGRLASYQAPGYLGSTHVSNGWLNNAMGWQVLNELRVQTPRGWDDPRFTGDYDEPYSLILGKTEPADLLFPPTIDDYSFGPQWPPAFFQDSERGYLIECRSATEQKTLQPMLDRLDGAIALGEIDMNDPDFALKVWEIKESGWEQYNGSAYGEFYTWKSSSNFQRMLYTARMKFHPHYHPYSTDMLARLVSEGVGHLVDPVFQEKTDKGDVFSKTYSPTSLASDLGNPVEEMDFSIDGAYSLYNWEVFFHIPILIASRFAKERKFEEARKWFHLVFDPTTTAAAGSPEHLRFWRFLPLSQDSETSRIRTLLEVLSDPGNPETIELFQKLRAQVEYSVARPFEPHGIARLRLSAYKKNVFMKYLDNILEWADQLFSLDTREAINEATQLYVLANDLLGPAPERMPREESGGALSFKDIEQEIDLFGNAAVQIEDWFVDVRLGTELVGDRTESEADAAAISGVATTTYFLVPDNERLAEYWNLVDDRLYKIRHGLDIHGNARSLSLFAPRIDPANLVAGGGASGSAAQDAAALLAPLPLYRFASILPKAFEFCNEVKSLGGALLSALEKKDAETLGIKRAQFEIAVLQMTRKIREEQIADAETALEALRKSRDNAQFRRDYYRNITKVNQNEMLQLSMMDASAVLQLAAQGVQMAVAPVKAIPTFAIGCSGFGGSPHVVAQAGGENAGSSLGAVATFLQMSASLASHVGSRASILASRQRREEEWKFQADSAQNEMDQIDLQIKGAQSRIRIAKMELSSQELQIRNSKAVEEFLKTKFTNEQLYSWMSGQLSRLYFAAYQMAFHLAKQVEQCFQFERGREPAAKVSFGAWDGLRKGLLAGEKLSMDLRRLELEYMKTNTREAEFTKTVSLVSLHPAVLIQLKNTGKCLFVLPESLFDAEHPGYYRRRIKNVSITIPCVSGPYSGINGRLKLKSGMIRAQPNKTATAKAPGVVPPNPVAFSIGQNDTGMFEANLRDERFLPFEGCGVVDSEWELVLRQGNNAFDIQTISDVVVRIQYTGTWDADLDSDTSSPTSITLPEDRVRMFSLRHEFADAWHAWSRSPSAGSEMAFQLSKERFPSVLRGAGLKASKATLVMGAGAVYAGAATVSIGTKSVQGNFAENESLGKASVASFPLSGKLEEDWKIAFADDIATLPDDIYLILEYSA